MFWEVGRRSLLNFRNLKQKFQLHKFVGYKIITNTKLIVMSTFARSPENSRVIFSKLLKLQIDLINPQLTQYQHRQDFSQLCYDVREHWSF